MPARVSAAEYRVSCVATCSALLLTLSDSAPFHFPAEPRPKPRRVRGQGEEEGGQEVQEPPGPSELRASDHEAAQHLHLGEDDEGSGRGDNHGDTHDSAGGWTARAERRVKGQAHSRLGLWRPFVFVNSLLCALSSSYSFVGPTLCLFPGYFLPPINTPLHTNSCGYCCMHHTGLGVRDGVRHPSPLRPVHSVGAAVLLLALRGEPARELRAVRPGGALHQRRPPQAGLPALRRSVPTRHRRDQGKPWLSKPQVLCTA